MITDLFGIDLPIIQAPMAGGGGSPLAIAVSNAGGLGSLPCAMLGNDSLRAELIALRAATRRPFNVNFFAYTQPAPDPRRESAWREALAPYYRELGIDTAAISPTPGRAPFDSAAADLLEEYRPAVVSFHFGLPDAALFARVRSTGAKILCTATTVEEARWLEARGVDAIIAQGIEAGGHRGHFLSHDLALQCGTFDLLPRIVAAVNKPVIAAGGIMDAESVGRALQLGAAGVQCGTAYLLCPEASISAPLRAALKNDSGRETALTNLITGRPARGIVNRLMRELGPLSSAPPEFPLALGAIAPLRTATEALGRDDFSTLWSGMNYRACRELSAADVTRALAAMLRT